MHKRQDVLIIIPAYNEEGSIENVVKNLEENYSEFDYVVVNDGSLYHSNISLSTKCRK